jgi:hypothetical protein
MSFLLGNSRKKRRGFVPPALRPSSLSASTDGGGGGGVQAMVQVQRKTLAPKTTVRQDAAAAVTPQQTQQSKQSKQAQGVISMEEGKDSNARSLAKRKYLRSVFLTLLPLSFVPSTLRSPQRSEGIGRTAA